MNKILIIDNYDSFVYNLYQYLGGLGAQLTVYRNDGITVEKVKELKPDKIVLSPGPGHPANARDFGVCEGILSEVKDTPILGVCLGHQGIINYFGGKIEKNTPMHGKTSEIEHNGKGLFSDVSNPLKVMRYHSLVGVEVPEVLEVTAKSKDDGVVMGVQHKELPIYGLQFHPESIMTDEGKKILGNFLKV